MHTETSWNSSDLNDDRQPVTDSKRSAVLSGTDRQSNDPAGSVAAPAALQPTRREKTGEYDALLSRVFKQVEDSGSAGFIGFTGCGRRCGVSTIAANVAIRAADQHNGPVLLVEANLLHPRQHLQFGTVRGPGLFEVLGNGRAIDQAVTATRVVDLFLLDAGTAAPRLPPIIMQDALEGFVQELRERYSLVVFDLPTDESLSSWAPLVRYLDSLLLVISSEETTQGDLRRIQNQCKVDKIKITGAILNRHRSYIPRLLRRS